MHLYHGTSASFAVPSLSLCKPHRDFGCGFYLAPNYFDALPMAIKHSPIGFIQTYTVKDLDGLSVLEFTGYSEAWLRFVVASRLGYVSAKYDLVIGNMAGGGANFKSKFSKFRRVNKPVAEVMSIMRHDLTSTNLGLQYAFLTEKALSKLTLIDTEMVEREDAV
uniref:DUF3990 domain-containing protein n=1 Tax=Siphoviridae sp. ctE6L85 TaxID=2826202 RepID=A0A8S5QQB5_9CAUD|nr:MAG TPA: Protein of unknown function (DUF3990) [Siphoviridae sp. ctE6L85]